MRTSRIYDLEKAFFAADVKGFGVTSFTQVSLEEDPEFDTVQSEEYLLKRQLHMAEKKEKKLRRKMRATKDPEF